MMNTSCSRKRIGLRMMMGISCSDNRMELISQDFASEPLSPRPRNSSEFRLSPIPTFPNFGYCEFVRYDVNSFQCFTNPRASPSATG